MKRLVSALAVLPLLATGLVATPAEAACETCTGGAIKVYAGQLTKRTISDWGYDVKQKDKAAQLAGSKSLRDRIFGDAGMEVLRIPVFATGDVNPKNKPINPDPANPEHQYAPVVAAVKAVQADYPGVKVFASLKMFTPRKAHTTFADWLFTKNGEVSPVLYATVLRKNLVYLKSQGVKVDVLGVDNEPALNGGGFSAADQKLIIDRLRTGLDKNDVPRPAFIAPENYHPDNVRLTQLGKSPLFTYAGTHFYSKSYRDQAPLLDAFAKTARQNTKKLWNSEFHWNVTDNADTSWSATMKDAFPALRSAFLHTDDGFTGLTWWSYQTGDSGKPWGLLHEKLVKTTNGATPLQPDAVHDRDGADIDTKLLTRAFKRGNTLVVWIVNTSTTATAAQQVKVSGATLNGDPVLATYPTTTTPTATRAGNTITFKAPARSVQVITVPASWAVSD